MFYSNPQLNEKNSLEAQMKIRDFNRGWEFHSDKSAEV